MGVTTVEDHLSISNWVHLMFFYEIDCPNLLSAVLVLKRKLNLWHLEPRRYFLTFLSG